MGNKLSGNNLSEHKKIPKLPLDKIRSIGLPNDINNLSPKSYYHLHKRLPE